MLRTLMQRWKVPGRVVLQAAALGGGPLVLTVCGAYWIKLNLALNDFRHAFYPAGSAVLHGRNPYPATIDVHQALPFVYPAVGAWLYAPLALLRYDAAAIVYFILMIAGLVAALLLLGVRDVRCYTVAMAWPAVIDGLESGAVGSLFVVCLALVWRYRDRDEAWIVAAFLGAVKLFVWPLGLYLIYTRRWRATAIAAVSGLLLLVLPWAAIGFVGMRNYPHMISELAAQEAPWSLRTANLALLVGLPAPVGYAVAVVLAVLAYRLRHDRQALMTVCVVVALAASPILWPHYFMLLLVPVALYSPRLSPLWLVPLACFAGPDTPHATNTWPSLIWWAATLVMLWMMVGRTRPESRPAPVAPRAVPSTH